MAPATFRAITVAACQSAGGKLMRFDRVAMVKLAALPTPLAAVTGARVLSALAEPGVVSIVLTAASLTTIRQADWRAAALPFLAVGLGAHCRRRLSRAVARERPPAERWLVEPEGFSLPSKHTTLGVLAVGTCARMAGARGPARHLVPLLAVVGVGGSRVYLGVHWPTDVLAGWLFAEAWLCLTDPLMPYRQRRASPARLIRPCDTWSCDTRG